MRFNDLRIRMKILLGATSIVLITGMLGVLAYVYIGKFQAPCFLLPKITPNLLNLQRVLSVKLLKHFLP